MNAIMKLLASVCVVTALAMSGCIDQVAVDQNGTVTIDTKEPTANVDVQVDNSAEEVEENVSDKVEVVAPVEDEVDVSEVSGEAEPKDDTETGLNENVTPTDKVVEDALEETEALEGEMTSLEEAAVDEAETSTEDTETENETITE